MDETIISNEETSQEATAIIQASSQEPISIKPSIAESERFIQFLNKRFDLRLRNDLIISIEETSPSKKGFFRSVMCSKVWRAEPSESKRNLLYKQEESQHQEKTAINSIVLSSHSLRDTPHETIAHELAHYINFRLGIKDCSSNQYHNKHFKSQAERLLLKVDRDSRRGYAYTSETPAFKEMLKEFKPSETAFKIFQDTQEPKQKAKCRMLKFSCDCGSIIRSAKNENKPLRAVCSYCNTEFKESEK